MPGASSAVPTKVIPALSNVDLSALTLAKVADGIPSCASMRFIVDVLTFERAASSCTLQRRADRAQRICIPEII
jgi:hypothetical protein